MNLPSVLKTSQLKPWVASKSKIAVKPYKTQGFETTVRFSANLDFPPETKATTTIPPQKLTSTLFGSPLKNIGWSALFGAAGLATLFIPPVAIAALGVSAVFLSIALFQGFSRSNHYPNTETVDTAEKNESTIPIPQILKDLKASIQNLTKVGEKEWAEMEEFEVKRIVPLFDKIEANYLYKKFSTLPYEMKFEIVELCYDSFKSKNPLIREWGIDFSKGMGLSDDDIQEMMKHAETD
ncbi:MAG: hypothetical protein K2X66_15150 [Cyanobacteria bacterium]|nr:hypothetical protein [Cyanobacteriota bacterium]